jgi:hypothetical protein
MNETTAVFLTDAQINGLINDAEWDIAVKSLCKESIQSKTTTASTRTVVVSCLAIHYVEYIPASGTATALRRINPGQIGQTQLTDTTPQFYFKWGNKLGIEPSPDAAYNLNVYTSIVPTIIMSSDTDEPQIPVELVPYIEDLAMVRVYWRDMQYGKSGVLYRQTMSNLQRIRDGILLKYATMRQDQKFPDYVKIIRRGG